MMQAYALAVLAAFLGCYAVAAPTNTNTAPLEKRTDHTGDATYFYQNGGQGSCGQYHADSDYVAALSNYWMKNQSPGPYCGRRIQVKNDGGGDQNYGKGKVITVTVADTCPDCDENHIDFSVGAFKGLTGGSLDPPGEFTITWHFCNVNGQC